MWYFSVLDFGCGCTNRACLLLWQRCLLLIIVYWLLTVIIIFVYFFYILINIFFSRRNHWLPYSVHTFWTTSRSFLFFFPIVTILICSCEEGMCPTSHSSLLGIVLNLTSEIPMLCFYLLLGKRGIKRGINKTTLHPNKKHNFGSSGLFAIRIGAISHWSVFLPFLS